MKAGLDYAQGDVVITMDADMQHPSSMISTMLTYWADGYDIVDTIRIDNKQCSYFKTITSRFLSSDGFLSDIAITENGADFRLLDKKVVKVLRDCREEYLFLRGMVSWVGFRRIQIPYQAGIRYAGTTKYSFKKMVLFAVCGITSFSIRPLRLAVLFAAFSHHFPLWKLFMYYMLFLFRGRL